VPTSPLPLADTPEEARAALDAIAASPPPPALPLGGQLLYRRYTPLVCECALAFVERTGRHGEWRTIYTALHEMIGHLFAKSPDEGAFDEVHAWESFLAVEHLALARCFTMLPRGVNVLDLVPLYQEFLTFLAGHDVVPAAEARRLRIEYEALAALSRPRAA